MTDRGAIGTHEQGEGERWRIFAAVPVNDAVRAIMQHVQNKLKTHAWAVRWVDPRLAHITLRFYGDTNVSAVSDIHGSLADVAACHESMLFQTGGVGAFPSVNRARVLWLGLDGDVTRLRALVTDINATGDADPGNGKRSFKPHVTLARLRNGAQPPPNFAEAAAALDLPSAKLAVDRIQLIRSVLSPKGPSYTVIGEWPLMTPAAELSLAVSPELHEHG